MTTKITEQEIEAIDKILQMYIKEEERHYEEWVSNEEDTGPIPTTYENMLKMEMIDPRHIYYSLRVLQEMVDKLKTKR